MKWRTVEHADGTITAEYGEFKRGEIFIVFYVAIFKSRRQAEKHITKNKNPLKVFI